jgi:hypothetical protein
MKTLSIETVLKNLESTNLSKFDKMQAGKKNIYRYSDNMSDKDKKDFRRKCRTELLNFALQGCEQAKQNKGLFSSEFFANFKNWNKKTFIDNSLSKESFSQIGEKSEKFEIINIFAELVQFNLAQVKK